MNNVYGTKTYYETGRGAIAVRDLTDGVHIHPTLGKHARGLRPGKQVDVVKLGRLYLAGASHKQIQAEVGCARKTVWRWITRLGLKPIRRKGA